jgi:hypothetical protein
MTGDPRPGSKANARGSHEIRRRNSHRISAHRLPSRWRLGMQSDGRGIRAAMRAPRRFSDQLAETREERRGQNKEERREMILRFSASEAP